MILKHSIDSYKSATLHLAEGSIDPSRFESDLLESLTEFRAKGVRGVWLQLLPANAQLVACAVRAGFEFHSAFNNQLTLSAWLPTEEPSRLPPAAAHFVAVGCFVLNSKDEILVVREKSGPSANMDNFWKLPGGLCDRQEDIPSAAVRELREETGIDARFSCIATIQETHHSDSAGPARKGTSDLYIVCVLKAQDESQQIVPCETEIEQARWMPAKQVLALPFYTASGSIFSEMFRHSYDVARGTAEGVTAKRLELKFLPMENNLFGVFKSHL